MRYWSDYASFLFCECNRFCHGSTDHDYEGYNAVKSSDTIDSVINGEYIIGIKMKTQKIQKQSNCLSIDFKIVNLLSRKYISILHVSF